MKVYSKDILYSQGDHPEEVFFILKGRVKLCYEVSEGEGEPMNIPFNMYVEGSYFGEMEMMLKHFKNKGRDGTAIVDSECHLLVMNSRELRIILRHFPIIEKQMKTTARKRRVHHEKAIEEAKKRAKDHKMKGVKAQLFQNGKHMLN